MEMKSLHKIEEMLCKEIEKIAEKGEMNIPTLDNLYKLTDVVKNIGKIEMLYSGDDSGQDGYSRAGEWEARGRFGRGEYDEGGSSYARRGQHYVRGHYSRDGGGGYSQMGGYSQGGGYGHGGGYSRNEGRQDMMGMLEEMMRTSSGPERERMMHMMEEMRRA